MSAPSYKFDEFELDSGRFELRRNGRGVKVERIPLELLVLLVHRKGELISRQEIAERLWGKDVFVDSDQGINTAIRKIRTALREDSEKPRFIQTVSGKGYRFVARVVSTNGEPVAAEAARVETQNSATTVITTGFSGRRGLYWFSGGVIIVILAALGLGLNLGGIRDRVFGPTVGPIHIIAVLPLANLSGDASQDYYADGMTDELITALARNRSLRVISRTSAMQFKSANKPLREIAHELGADGILEGSVKRTGNNVHVNLQLIYAPTDTHVWAESYDRELSQAYLLPQELSQTIAREAKAETTPTPPRPYIGPEAHDAYLRGWYFWTAGNDQRSLEYFEKAIQIQPDYAAAWAGLSDSYGLRAVNDEAPARDVMAQAEAAARKAVELDASLPAAHASLAGWYFFYGWDLPRAVTECRRAIELDPTIADQHHLYSYILFAMNRNQEAREEQKRATDLDPFVRPWGLGYAYLQLREFDAAIAELRMRADAMPNDAGTRLYLSAAYWHKGMWSDSQREFEKGLQLSGLSESAVAAHRAFELGGERAVEEWGVRDAVARARKGYVAPYAIAQAYAFLGDRANTLKFLEQSYREHYPWLILLQTEPVFDFVHSDPRYQALIKKIHLPPAY